MFPDERGRSSVTHGGRWGRTPRRPWWLGRQRPRGRALKIFKKASQLAALLPGVLEEVREGEQRHARSVLRRARLNLAVDHSAMALAGACHLEGLSPKHR